MQSVDTAITVLTESLVDYAGLFPPAALDMPSAVAEYARYLSDHHSSTLARFIVPVARLAEFTDAQSGHAVEAPWPLAGLAGADIAADLQRIDDFNVKYRTRVLINVVEVKAATVANVEQIAEATAAAVSPLDLYIEVPINGNLDPLVTAIAQAGARAKIRTGGVTPDAFPTPAQIIHFMRVCVAHEVPFKATAGLHHPISGEYRLTYAPDSPVAPMYGFLNVFLAAAFLDNGVDDALLTALLTERDASVFQFTESGVTWRGHTLTVDQLRRTRECVARSFGSCSFREPVDELTALKLL